MCLKTPDSKVKILDEPLFVWKLLYKGISAHHGYKYKINKLNPEVQIHFEEVYYEKDLFIVEDGYHSWVNKCVSGNWDYKTSNDLFVIPKGAKYVEGIQHNYEKGIVSSNIVYLGNIKNPLTHLRKLIYKLKYCKK